MFRMSFKAIALFAVATLSIFSLTGCVVTDADLEDDGPVAKGEATVSAVMEVEPLALIRSTYSDDESLADPDLILINSKAEMDALGSEALKANDQIDFETESVIMLMLGEQPDGAWCKILGATKVGNEIEVLAQVNRSSVQATSTVFPYAMATVKKTSGVLIPDFQNLEDQPEP